MVKLHDYAGAYTRVYEDAGPMLLDAKQQEKITVNLVLRASLTPKATIEVPG